MKNIFIGIDPDSDKNGVAIYYRETKNIQLFNFDYFELFEKLLKTFTYYENNLLVMIEKGELNKAIFTAHKAKTKAVAAKIGVNVGRNFEVTNIIEKYCKKHGIDYAFYAPKSAKWNAKYLKERYGITKRNNQEQRDALRCISQFIIVKI